MVMGTNQRRVVLITGASSGIGLACAVHLARKGYRVYGTSRRPLDSGAIPFSMLAMDVTDNASVAECLEKVLEREGRLDAVVNNAGIALAGAVENTSIEEAQRQLDVNFFGVLRVCRAALPSMRRQASGCIVNIGSIGGLIALPYQAMYSASKFALEGMTEALRMEVRRFGVNVVLIEPGDHKTALTQNRWWTDASVKDEVYRRHAVAAVARMAHDEQNGSAPERVAQLLERILDMRNPRLRYTTGPILQRAAVWLKRLLPYRCMEYGMGKYYRPPSG